MHENMKLRMLTRENRFVKKLSPKTEINVISERDKVKEVDEVKEGSECVTVVSVRRISF